MINLSRVCSLLVVVYLASGVTAIQAQQQPRTLIVKSGSLKLRALLWQPKGDGPFPAVLFSPGSGLQPRPEIIGPLFARHGYVFLGLFRSGQGLSGGQGAETSARVEAEREAKGDDSANLLQLKLLEGEQFDQSISALALLRSMKIVDSRRVAVVGHSFGGLLAMLLAEHDPSIRAVANFGGGARSWPRSSYLRDRLIVATKKLTTPVLFLQATNDYSTAPTEVLAAELARQGKIQQTRIYPAFGKTPGEGHSIIYLSIPTWEHDVFQFLDLYIK